MKEHNHHGRLLKELLSLEGLSISSFSRLAGISRKSVYNYIESDFFSDKQQNIICTALRLPKVYFVDENIREEFLNMKADLFFDTNNQEANLDYIDILRKLRIALSHARYKIVYIDIWNNSLNEMSRQFSHHGFLRNSLLHEILYTLTHKPIEFHLTTQSYELDRMDFYENLPLHLKRRGEDFIKISEKRSIYLRYTSKRIFEHAYLIIDDTYLFTISKFLENGNIIPYFKLYVRNTSSLISDVEFEKITEFNDEISQVEKKELYRYLIRNSTNREHVEIDKIKATKLEERLEEGFMPFGVEFLPQV